MNRIAVQNAESCLNSAEGDKHGQSHEFAMAGVGVRRIAGNARHAASVDADHRQDPADADTLAESQLARAALRHLERADHIAYSLWIPLLRHSIRFHRPCA